MSIRLALILIFSTSGDLNIDLTPKVFFFTKVVGLSTNYRYVQHRLPFVATIRGLRDLNGAASLSGPARIGVKC